MKTYVHNHGTDDGRGLACGEYRTADGTLRGRCLDAAPRMAPLPAARHAAAQGRHRALRTAQPRRLARTAHVGIVAAIAIGLTAFGAVVLARLIADDAMCVFAVGCWGLMVGGTAQLYAEAVIRR